MVEKRYKSCILTMHQIMHTDYRKGCECGRGKCLPEMLQPMFHSDNVSWLFILELQKISCSSCEFRNYARSHKHFSVWKANDSFNSFVHFKQQYHKRTWSNFSMEESKCFVVIVLSDGVLCMYSMAVWVKPGK